MSAPAPVMPVFHRLRAHFGPIPTLRPERPIACLVQTILSQNTSDTNSLRAYRSLRRRFPAWDDVRSAPMPEIINAIRSGGLANIKAARIRGALETIKQRYGNYSLSALRGMDAGEAIAHLTGIKGVGIKTAACVMLFALRTPVMPVDTHVFRVSGRLGWIGPRTRIEHARNELERLIPAGRILDFHLYLIDLGRTLCRPRRPRCPACPLSRLCPRRNCE